nr:hypothetical protein [uncultured Bacteroides sp.]
MNKSIPSVEELEKKVFKIAQDSIVIDKTTNEFIDNNYGNLDSFETLVVYYRSIIVDDTTFLENYIEGVIELAFDKLSDKEKYIFYNSPYGIIDEFECIDTGDNSVICSSEWQITERLISNFKEYVGFYENERIRFYQYNGYV